MTKSFIQGNNTFYIREMDPFKALALLGDLQKTFLPALGAAFGTNAKVNDVLEKEIDIGKLLTTLSSAIDGEILVNSMQRILDGDFISVEIGTAKPVKLDKAVLMQLYKGDILGMAKLAFEVLKMNYASFFIPMLTQFGKAQEKIIKE